MKPVEVEGEIDSIQFETYQTGDIRALLSFKNDEQLKELNFSYLSVPIDPSVTEAGKLCIARGDKVFMVFENNNMKYYELRRYTNKLTDLPDECAVCKKPVRKIKNLQRKVKKIFCDNPCECSGHSRAIILRLFKIIGIGSDLANVYMNDHYGAHITHLWDLVLVHKQNDGDPNTEPRQKMWKGKDELWNVEKTLYSFLKNPTITDKQFWYIGFGVDLDLPRVYDASQSYPKVIDDNFHMVKQLNMFFDQMKKTEA